MSAPIELPAWKALREHLEREGRSISLREEFRRDPERAERFSIELDEDLLLDFSKCLIVDRTLELLGRLAQEAGLGEATDRMFSGEKINTTEDRAVLHVALRRSSREPLPVDGVDVMPQV
ncbi:MAG TPA: glucose-6-phosphate isomerase, partial [Planctomycetota bacterium]|nr:glucose-6-phosphate isomerase [Planctomycetota bacterium]